MPINSLYVVAPSAGKSSSGGIPTAADSGVSCVTRAPSPHLDCHLTGRRNAPWSSTGFTHQRVVSLGGLARQLIQLLANVIGLRCRLRERNGAAQRLARIVGTIELFEQRTA